MNCCARHATFLARMSSLLLVWILLNAASASTDSLADSFNVLSTRPHPRTLSVDVLRANLDSLSSLRNVSRKDITHPKVIEPGARPLTSNVIEALRLQDIQSAVFGEEERVVRLALAAVALKEEPLSKAAIQRALDLAGWAPRGATGIFIQDFAGLSVTWTLALAYDWLHDHMSTDEKRKLIAAIKPRVEDMLSPPVKGQPTGWAGLDWGRKLDRWPYDSHGAVMLARLAVICTALAGEDPLFDGCVRAVVPRYFLNPCSPEPKSP